MARFVGNYEHTIDDKGRLILPAPFRAKVAEGVVVTPLGQCLAILPVEEFDRMADLLEEQVALGNTPMSALRSFTSQADETAPDSQGRLRLLAKHREIAGLDRSVVVSGVHKRIEVWSAELWESEEPTGTASLAEAAARGYGLGPR